MRAQDEAAREKPGGREQRETRPEARTEGLECRAEGQQHFFHALPHRITSWLPQSLCHFPPGHVESLACMDGWKAAEAL